ncbi:MAG: aspartyl/asparaginyl beta-hydroxylase domain-containing protein [Steroidobacteraceae bacterium]
MNDAKSKPGSKVEEAQLLLRAGRIEEAERVWLDVLERSPLDVQALNMVALASLRTGQVNRAADLLRRAVGVRPSHATSHHHLARALELLGDLEGARRHYIEAVRHSKELPAARLHLGALLERLGDHDGALLQYARVLSEMQGQGRWVDVATTPPALQTQVRRAAQVVREGRRALLFRLLEPLARDYGVDSLQRVARMLRVHLGEESVDYPDPRQRPTFLYFPDLPTSPWIDPRLIPGIDAYEMATPRILDELLALLPEARGSERVFLTAEVEAQNLRGSRGEPSWTGHYFYRHGQIRQDNLAACPATAAALAALPLNIVRDHGPEVMFSVFTPGTRLLPHRGVTNTRIVTHLPLIVPPDCALEVGGERHTWRKGEVVAFDDTYEHSAWNESPELRVVLIADLWNPHLTEVERLATARVVETLGDFNQAMEAS